MTVADLSTEPILDHIDGLRVVWSPSPGPRSHAALVFRVGQADETLPDRGITHLLEHLALVGTDGSVDHNGQTDLFTTAFTVSGTLTEIDSHLAGVVANLTALPLDRIEVEKRILEAEERGRSGGLLQQLALYRYGATGIGLTAFPEWGLHRAGPADLAQWVDRYFTADNAVLVVTGPQRPSQLTWRLPAGVAQVAPEPAPPMSRVPGFVHGQLPGPALIAEVPRSTAASVFATLADRAMMDHVRGERGLAYRAWATYLPISAERAVFVASTDAVADMSQEAVDGFLDVLFGLAAHGPDAQVLAEVIQNHVTAPQDPDAGYGLAHHAARELLLGRPMPRFPEIWAETSALKAADMLVVASMVLRSAIVLLPPEARALGRGGFTPFGAADTEPVGGKALWLPNQPDQPAAKVIVGSDGVSSVFGNQTVTIRFHDAAALLRSPDGSRTLIARSADQIELDPEALGPTRIEQIDHAVGESRWIDLPGPSATEREPESQLPPVPLHRYQKFLIAPMRAALVAFLVILVFTMIWPMDDQENLRPPGDLLLLGLMLLAAWWDHTRYKKRARRDNAERAAHRARQERERYNAEGLNP